MDYKSWRLFLQQQQISVSITFRVPASQQFEYQIVSGYLFDSACFFSRRRLDWHSLSRPLRLAWRKVLGHHAVVGDLHRSHHRLHGDRRLRGVELLSDTGAIDHLNLLSAICKGWHARKLPWVHFNTWVKLLLLLLLLLLLKWWASLKLTTR